MAGLLPPGALQDFSTWLDDIVEGQEPGQTDTLYLFTRGTKVGPQGRPVPADIIVVIDGVNWWGSGNGKVVLLPGGEQATGTDRIAYPVGEKRIVQGATVARGGALQPNGTLIGGTRYRVLNVDEYAVKWAADLQFLAGQEQHG